MTAEHASPKPSQPDVGRLFLQYLERQAAAQAEGLAPDPATGEVTPFDAIPGQAVEPRLAWTEAQAALPLWRPERLPVIAPLPTWAALVRQQEPVMALPLAVGNFPQLVRNFQPLVHAARLSTLRPNEAAPLAVPELAEWVEEVAGQPGGRLLAVGVLRLARHFDEAAQHLDRAERELQADWQAALANERAALAWQRGQPAEALRLWERQPASPAVSFNRGMALLFDDRAAEARPLLAEAAAQLPEAGGWHHLAGLYLALAEMHA